MSHYVNFTIADFAKKASGVTVYHGEVTALNIAGYLTQVGALRTAIEGIIDGVIQKEQLVIDSTVLTKLPASDPQATIKTKWLVTYRGASNENFYTLEIPTADETLRYDGVYWNQRDNMAEDDPAYIAFKSAFEAIAKCPDDPSMGVALLGIKLVGRNLS